MKTGSQLCFHYLSPCLQETLHPFGRFHLAGRHCGGGVKVTQLYYVESKAEQLTRVRSLNGEGGSILFIDETQ